MGKPRGELKNLNYEIFIVCLTLLSLSNFLFVVLIPMSAVATEVIYATDAILSIVFLGDFVYRLKSATDKTDYFIKQRGWVDLLSSLPFPQAKILRFFRLIRVYRLLKAIGAKNVLREFFKDRANSAIYIVVFMIFLLLEYGSIIILSFESANPDASIVTAEEAMWYVFVTITTVGYGDYSPTTSFGRLAGVAVMIVGVGLFGVLTGFLATSFVPPKDEPKEDTETKQILRELQELKKEIKKLS